jgi:ATP-binding cassette, subfamily B, multidrug efflux pump
MRYLMKYFMKYRVPFFIALFFLTVEATSDIIQPTLMSKIVDEGVKNSDLDTIITYGTYMLIVTFIGAIGALTRNYFASTVSQRFGRDLRLIVFKKIHRLSFKSIDEMEEGALITRLSNDITQIQHFSQGIMRIFVKAPITCMGAIVMMFLLDAKIALVLLAVIPVASLLIYISMRIGFPLFLRIQTVLDRLNTTISEYLSGVRVVKAFNRSDYEEDRFSHVNENLTVVSMKTMRVMNLFTPAIILVVNLGIIAIFYFGGNRVYQGDLEVGKIMAFVMYMTQILHSLSLMMNILNVYVRASASSTRIQEVLLADETFEPRQPESLISKDGHKVEFRKVGFSYQEGGKLVLKNINFEVSSGETIGIIGSTGSGKTSLMNLLMRFYEATEGEILWNDRCINRYDAKDLRDQIGYVPQKNLLFSGTIKDNIKWGKEASDDDIIKACEMACIHDFIKDLPLGYHTILGQGGVNLSGGQKQRLCIARALIKNPQLLILDDCTSAIDANTEAKIRKSLRLYSKDLSCLLVSQKISSIMSCEQIIVLENGEMMGSGTHEELLNNCSVYQAIYESQIGHWGERNE